MSYLEFGGRRHPIPVGEIALGCEAAGRVVLGPDVQTHFAILQGTSDGQVAIRRAEADAEILINGVRLGPQPSPLLHGDKVEVAGQEQLPRIHPAKQTLQGGLVGQRHQQLCGVTGLGR